MQKSNRKFEKVITVLIALAIFAIGIRIGLSQSGNALKSVVEPGSMTIEASYIIFTDGTTVYARNGTTGALEFSNSNASYVIQSALNTLTPGRTWQEKVVLRGNFTLTSGIIVPSYTILEIDGKLERGFNGGYMIDTDNSVQNQFINIVGGMIDGKWDTYNGSGIRLQASRWCKITDSIIYDHRTDAITLNATPGKENYDIWISGNQINSAGQYCLNLGISDIWVEDNYIEGSDSIFVVYVNAGAVTLAHNHIMSGGLADCVYIASGGMNNAIHGGEIENCRNGVTSFGSHTIIDGVLFHLNNRSAIYLPIGSESSTITGCSFYDNSRNIQGYSDIILENTVNNTITGNVFSTPTTNTRSAVRETGTADYNIISGNTIDAANYYNPVIEKVGSHTVVKDNTGYNLPQESAETASYIISTDGTNYYAKNGTTGQIDFQSTNASQVINNILSNCTSAGADISFQSGHTYTFTSPIYFDNTMYPVWIHGGGWETILSFNVANHYLFERNGAVGYVNFHRISDLKIVLGNNAAGGIKLITGCNWWKIDNVWIYGGANTTQVGVLVDSTTTPSQWNTISNCLFYGVGESVRLDNGAMGNTVINPIINGPTNIGIDIENTTGYSDGNNVLGGTIVGVNAATGVKVSSYDNVFSNLYIELNNTGSVGYNFTSSSSKNLVSGGTLIVVAGMSLVNNGVGNKFESITEFPAENSGNATVSNNDWIAHGLATTPTIVTLTPSAYNVTAYVLSTNSTHIKIGLYYTTTGTNVTSPTMIYWHAEV